MDNIYRPQRRHHLGRHPSGKTPTMGNTPHEQPPPPEQTATAADGTHSCILKNSLFLDSILVFLKIHLFLDSNVSPNSDSAICSAVDCVNLF